MNYKLIVIIVFAVYIFLQNIVIYLKNIELEQFAEENDELKSDVYVQDKINENTILRETIEELE
ncbi:MAG: hypothetical protein GF329_14160, partial [Candidatus Lokiarchaeota archaeon]|nr:hypothetical protein [Candidatus Lokiarchaeota archaeon]